MRASCSTRQTAQQYHLSATAHDVPRMIHRTCERPDWVSESPVIKSWQHLLAGNIVLAGRFDSLFPNHADKHPTAAMPARSGQNMDARTHKRRPQLRTAKHTITVIWCVL